MTELRFKPGDKVYFAFYGGGKFGVVKRITSPSLGVALVDFGDDERVVAMAADMYLSSEVDLGALPKSGYKKMLDERSEIFKPGAVIMECHYGIGTVCKVLPGGLIEVDFKFYGRHYINPRTCEAWLAEGEDMDWHPSHPAAEPEPLCKPDEMTLENLREELEGWESSVSSFEAGFYSIYAYTHDLCSRECLHGILNGFARQGLAVPDALKRRIEAADKRFIELTHEEELDVWDGARIYDKNIFWYYYRMLNQ